VTNLIVRDYLYEYEIVRAGGKPLSSCGECYPVYDHYLTRQFITRLSISIYQWRGVLMRLGIGIPASFHHANEILDAVARICTSGKLQFYKLPKIEYLKAIPCGQGMGICFVKGPKPHCNTPFTPVVISTTQEAEALIASLTAKDADLLRCITANGLMTAVSSTQGNRKLIVDKLAAKEILAYKIPVYGNTPPKKQGELIPATGPGYDKVPLAPESKPAPQKVADKRVEQKVAPQSLGDCEQKLAEARVNLEKDGYKPKYTDKQQLEKVQNNSVASERFLVSFQSKNTDPNAKLAFQRDSGLAPIWSTSFDQLEYADSDPELIAKVLGTTYDPKKDYVLHIVDRGEDLTGFGQNTIVPTWDNIQAPTQKYLGGKHDPKVLTEVMTPEYQQQYAKDIEGYHEASLSEFDEDDQNDYASKLSWLEKSKFFARHNVRTEIGANSEFTGNGLTQSREGGSQYGVVETLTLENNPPPISAMKNVKTVVLKPRSTV
jgi:hypothetical protein